MLIFTCLSPNFLISETPPPCHSHLLHGHLNHYSHHCHLSHHGQRATFISTVPFITLSPAAIVIILILTWTYQTSSCMNFREQLTANYVLVLNTY